MPQTYDNPKLIFVRKRSLSPASFRWSTIAKVHLLLSQAQKYYSTTVSSAMRRSVRRNSGKVTDSARSAAYPSPYVGPIIPICLPIYVHTCIHIRSLLPPTNDFTTKLCMVCMHTKKTNFSRYYCEHVVYIQTGNFICSDQQQQNEIITNISLMRQRRLALCTTRQKLCNRRSKCNIETCVVGTGSARLSLGRVAGRVGDQCTQQHCSKPTSAIFCCKIHDM